MRKENKKEDNVRKRKLMKQINDKKIWKKEKKKTGKRFYSFIKWGLPHGNIKLSYVAGLKKLGSAWVHPSLAVWVLLPLIGCHITSTLLICHLYYTHKELACNPLDAKL